MKIWCETCSGFGKIGNYLEEHDCPNCDGEGFVESEGLRELIDKDAELDRRENGVAVVNVSNKEKEEYLVCGHCGDLAKTNYCGNCGRKLIWDSEEKE